MVIGEGSVVGSGSAKPKKQVKTLVSHEELKRVFVQMAADCNDFASHAFGYAEGTPPTHFQVTVATLNDSGEWLSSGFIDSIKI